MTKCCWKLQHKYTGCHLDHGIVNILNVSKKQNLTGDTVGIFPTVLFIDEMPSGKQPHLSSIDIPDHHQEFMENTEPIVNLQNSHL